MEVREGRGGGEGGAWWRCSLLGSNQCCEAVMSSSVSNSSETGPFSLT